MQPVTIRPIPKKVTAILDPGMFVLPADLRHNVDTYWQTTAAHKPGYFNGVAFMITDLQLSDEELLMHMSQTDYAHLFYTNNVGDLGEYNMRSIYPTNMVITSDNKLIFGRMGSHTAHAGKIFCCSGTIDAHAVTADGMVDPSITATLELGEELGINVEDAAQVVSYEPRYLVEYGQGKSIALVYICRLAITGEAFLQAYHTFTQTTEPEFDELFCIDRTPEAVELFKTAHRADFGKDFEVILDTVVQ